MILSSFYARLPCDQTNRESRLGGWGQMPGVVYYGGIYVALVLYVPPLQIVS